MNIIIDRTWKQGSLVNIEDLRGLTFQAEAQAHTFRISGVDAAGNPITLTGTPSGVMLRPDNTDVALTCAVSDGKVTATLPAECYDVPGRVGITIYLTSNSQKVCIYSAITSVNRTSSGTASPGTTSSVVDLVNAIEAAIAQIPASDTNLKGALAPTYSDSAVYAVGQYAWYDGKLYKCTTAITTSESWTSGHWTEAKLAQDVTGLKSAISETTGDIKTFIDYNDGIISYKNLVKEINVGKYSEKRGDKVVLSNSDSFGCVIIPVKKDNYYSINTAPQESNFSMFADNNNNFIGYFSSYKVTDYLYTAPSDGFMYLCNSGWNSASLNIVVFNTIFRSAVIPNMDITHYPYDAQIGTIWASDCHYFDKAYANASGGKILISGADGFGLACRRIKKGKSYAFSAPIAFAFTKVTNLNYEVQNSIDTYATGTNRYTFNFDGYLFASVTPKRYFYIAEIGDTSLQNTWTVSKSGNLKTIGDGCYLANDGDTVFIKGGTYREQLALWGKRIHLVGEDKYSCILIDSAGDYDNPPLEMNMGSVSNITIIEDYNGVNQDNRYPYCIHTESNDGIGDGAVLVIDNCVLKNVKQNCYGLGMSHDLTVVVTNTEMHLEYPEGETRLAGAFLWHTNINDQITNQHLIVRNCEFWSGSQYAMIIGNLGTNGYMDYSFINNHFYAKEGTPNSNDIILVDDRHYEGQVFTLLNDSWGNNIPNLNYSGT